MQERAERCFLTKEGVRKVILKLNEKGYPVSTKLTENGNIVDGKVSTKLTKSVNKVDENQKEKKKRPPTPPIKKKKKKIEEVTPNGVSDANAPTSKKEEPKVYALQHRCREFFEKIYEQKKGDKYYYAAKDAAALSQLLNKIKFLMPENEKNNEARLEENFQIFINTIFCSKILDAWIIDNISIPLINNKFNEIYSQLKNGNSNNTNRREVGSKHQPQYSAEFMAELYADITSGN